MKFNIFDGKNLINSIEASKAFCTSYCKKNGYTFEEIPSSIDMGALKTVKIATTKADLATYLAEHPLTWIDGNKYTVTADK